MNPFILDPTERLGDWKKFRTSLPALTEEKQLTSVAEYWANAPLVNFAYDIEIPASIPTPWEMINACLWCPMSVAIGMEFTLRLSGWDAPRLQLHRVVNREISKQCLCLIVDNKFALGHAYREVISYPQPHDEVYGRWSYNGRQYHPISVDFQ